MILKRVACKLSLTKKSKIELSDVIYKDATVIEKRYDPFGAFGDVSIWSPLIYYPTYEITFKGESGSFTEDNKELFKSLNINDNVRIAYKEAYFVVRDYVPPDFSTKKELERYRISDRFVGVEKI